LSHVKRLMIILRENQLMNLTPEQIDAVKQGASVRVLSPEIGAECVVIRRDVYEQIQELLDDWDPRLMRPHVARMMAEDWQDLNVYEP
jgi:hypothetical protein